MSNSVLILISCLTISLFTTSCASTTEENIERITVGMNKAVVLDIVGDPSTTSRSNSVDNWIYKYYTNDIEKHVNVSFKNGRVIKVRNFDPDEGEGTYQDYTKKIKSDRKSKDGSFKNLDE